MARMRVHLLPPRLPVLLACLLLLAACTSPEEKLLDRRQSLRTVLDELHASYAASAPAAPEAERAQGDSAEPGAGLVRRLVGEFDRAQLESYCLASGRGERPFAISSRVEAFVREPSNAERCRKAARLEAEVAALEREVAARRGGAPR